MAEPSNYWQLIQVESSGRSCRKDLKELETFFKQCFPDYGHLAKPDRESQRQLISWIKQDTEEAKQAELCLRCYISQALLSSCLSLVKRFGERYGFTAEELLPLVLGGFNPNTQNRNAPVNSEFVSISDQVLSSFDPDKSGLSTWCDRILKSNPEVRRFLAEHGVQLKTNWLILNQATIGRLRRVFQHFDRTEREIEEAEDLLKAFHQVYRAEILESRGNTRRAYPVPDTQYLEKMSRQMVLSKGLSIEQVLDRLGQLATSFRQYDSQRPASSPQIDTLKSPSKDELREQLEQYCIPCLKEAFDVVLRRRIDAFNQRERNQKKEQKFLEALYLFHCEGLSLGTIAPRINLNNQPAVSRLLKLKDLRDDVRIETIKHLKASVLELARTFRDPETLKHLENQVNAYLEGYLNTLMESAQREAYSSHRLCQTDSLFSQTLCQTLRNWR